MLRLMLTIDDQPITVLLLPAYTGMFWMLLAAS